MELLSYISFVNEYINLDHMIPAFVSSKYLLPHDSVFKIGKSGIRVRVVFNGFVLPVEILVQRSVSRFKTPQTTAPAAHQLL